jgi:arylmalonate decarboxylase
MIFPPADYPVPPEAKLLYPTGVTFLAEGLAFNGMTIESYDEAVPRIVPAALKLKERGATAISIMGTSLTFYKGAGFNQELIERVHSATGLPATSMSSGIVDGLKVAGAKRVAVATAYTDIVNATLERFLKESGFAPRRCVTGFLWGIKDHRPIGPAGNRMQGTSGIEHAPRVDERSSSVGL